MADVIVTGASRCRRCRRAHRDGASGRRPGRRLGSGPIPMGQIGAVAWVVPAGDGPSLDEAPRHGGQGSGAVGGPQGAVPGGRPPAHGGRKDQAAGPGGLRALTAGAEGGQPGPIRPGPRRRPRGAGRSAHRACRGSYTARTPTIIPSMMSSTSAATTVSPCTKTVAGCRSGRSRAGRRRALGDVHRNLELRYGPTTRRAWRPGPSRHVRQTTTSSDSMERSPTSLRSRRPRKRSVSSRP